MFQLAIGAPPPGVEVKDAGSEEAVMAEGVVRREEGGKLVLHMDGCTCPRGRSWKGGVPDCLRGLKREDVVQIFLRQIGFVDIEGKGELDKAVGSEVDETAAGDEMEDDG